ncbi:vacuolar protein sorting-associated protein 41 homolog [Hibiscus syriacus]|uniref:vacuolar protein sorting-associated protein 41 homolog n=1 Tax=Hibiscus syriacus TaxID=106335 RepID=UPI0019213035|nr:vacuolar protein sorting-associated protein 41 homolog [Hibiscus syriacus]
MGGSIPSLLSGDSASCIVVSERMIALGTHDGTVHILDFLGNQVKEFAAHSAAMNDLSFDIEGEYIGSCSDDGSVILHSLFTDEKLKFEYHHPMKAIALDPDYARKSSRRFVTGGLAGHLYLNTKKWLGYKDQVLHSGEGPIHAVKWRTSLIAWANDMGVKVYDAANDQRITFIERPRGSPHPEILLPHLVWQDDALLVIGWGTYVKIASIRSNLNKGANGTYKHVSMSNMNQVNIVTSFQTSCYISGIAPFGDSLVVLAYILGEEDGEKEFSCTIPSRQVCVLYSSEKAKFLVMVYTPYFEAFCAIISALSVSVPASLPIYLYGVTPFLTEATAMVTGNAQRPEVRIVSWNNDELATDALPVHGFEHYTTMDYSLAHAPFSSSSYARGQWAAGDEPIYYIDAKDHIAWLLQHGCHEKALAAVEAGQGRSELLDEVETRYLDHLIVERKYAEAASLCPKLLRGSPKAWERWVFHFAHLRQLPVLVPYMPTETPKLRDTAYEVALVALATNPGFYKDLVSTVKSWPRVIYSMLPVISAIEPQLNTSSMTDALKEALAELYVINGQYEKAFSLYADLTKPDIFDFIERHNLQNSIQEKVVPLMIVDCKQAVNLLLQNQDLITPYEVVSQLLNTRKKCDATAFS